MDLPNHTIIGQVLTQYDHIFELMKMNPQVLNKKSIYENMSKSSSHHKQFMDYITTRIQITPYLTFTESLRQFLEFGYPKALSELHYFINVYVNKFFPHFSTQAPFNQFANPQDDFTPLHI
jgi:hypothetical protein